MPLGVKNHSPIITVGVFAALGYDITSANLSSPQTFNLNAGQRGPTLDFWLNLNVGEALAWGIAGSVIDKTPYPIVGVGIAITSMYLKYQYAVRSGSQSGLPDMENHQTGSYNLGGGGYG